MVADSQVQAFFLKKYLLNKIFLLISCAVQIVIPGLLLPYYLMNIILSSFFYFQRLTAAIKSTN